VKLCASRYGKEYSLRMPENRTRGE